MAVKQNSAANTAWKKRQQEENRRLAQLVAQGKTASGRTVEETTALPTSAKYKYADFLEKHRAILNENATEERKIDDILSARKDGYYARNYIQKNAETYDAENGAGSSAIMLSTLDRKIAELDDYQSRLLHKNVQSQVAESKRLYDIKKAREDAIKATTLTPVVDQAAMDAAQRLRVENESAAARYGISPEQKQKIDAEALAKSKAVIIQPSFQAAPSAAAGLQKTAQQMGKPPVTVKQASAQTGNPNTFGGAVSNAATGVWNVVKDLPSYLKEVYNMTLGVVLGNTYDQAQEEYKGNTGVGPLEMIKSTLVSAGGQWNNGILGILSNTADLVTGWEKVLGMKPGRNIYKELQTANMNNLSKALEPILTNGTWLENIAMNVGSMAINSAGNMLIGQAISNKVGSNMGGGVGTVNPALRENKINFAANMAQMSPFALQDASDNYEQARKNGANEWQAAASGLFAGLMGLATNSKAYEDYGEKLGLGVATNQKMLAGVSSAYMGANWGERAFTWFKDALTTMGMAEGLQEVSESLAIKLNDDMWGRSVFDTDKWQAWAKGVKKDFVYGYLSGALFYVTAIPAYAPSRQMLTGMIEGDTQTTPEQIGKFIAQVAEDVQDEKFKPAVEAALEDANKAETIAEKVNAGEPLEQAREEATSEQIATVQDQRIGAQEDQGNVLLQAARQAVQQEHPELETGTPIEAQNSPVEAPVYELGRVEGNALTPTTASSSVKQPAIQNANRATGEEPSKPAAEVKPSAPASVIKSYGHFDPKRYENPWVSEVNDEGKPNYSKSVGTYTTAKYNAGLPGDLVVSSPEDGKIYAYGQMDYRGKGAYEYAQFTNGHFEELTRREAVRLLSEQKKAGKNKAAEAQVARQGQEREAAAQILKKAAQEATKPSVKNEPSKAAPAKPAEIKPQSSAIKQTAAAVKLMNKWMQNEYVNITPGQNDPQEAKFKRFFQKYYEAGRTGKKITSVPFDESVDAEFPVFLQDTFYQQGVKDAQPTHQTLSAKNPVKPSEAKKNTETGKALSPSETMANQLLERYIQKNTQFNSAVLFELADKAFGGTQAEGKYTPKDAYDALELAVNKYLLSGLSKNIEGTNGDAKKAVSFVERLNKFLATLPTQTKRTAEQEQYQQFSTPPNIAYLAAWAANVQKTDTVLEPSAGIGGLAVFPKAWGATVVVNELSERRLDVLKSMGFDRYFSENAEQINNILPDDVKPTLVIMNPPFSSTAGRTSTNSTHNAEKHIEQALLRLSDRGRLVAILGKGMDDDALAFKPWWKKIRQNYTVRANISIDGSNYTKYGTSWGVQLVVIDKTGPQTGDTITGEYKDLTQIPSVLEGIRNDRTILRTGTGAEQTAAVLAGEKGVDGSGRSAALSDASRSASPSDVVGRSTSGETSDAGRRGRNGIAVQDAGGSATSVRVSSEPKPEEAVQSAYGGDRGLQRGGNLVANEGVQDGSGNVAGNAGHGLRESIGELRSVREQQVKPVSDDGVYAEYIPSPLPFSGVKKHPANLVESAAMAAVGTPKATYIPDLPVELIKNGELSGAQLENIVFAGQAHTQILPDGTRKGYFIGDGTGVGKGRQISGIILDNFRQGRTKAVWVSKSAKLLPDAVRDWTDIGGMKDDVFSLNSVKLNSNIEAKKGILFAGYSTLRSEKNNVSRLKQIVNWLGKDYDGVIAFDEVHTMGNLLGKAGKRGSTDGSKVAQAGAELQAALPNARVVYVSATGATDVSELSFASRLGLWGEGTAFKSLNDFVEQISSSGLSAMELVARDMKAMGTYLSRSISYSGVEYETLEHDMTPVQREIYDTMSEAWQITMQHMNEALSVTNQKKNGAARSRARSAYFSSMQRFYSQILTSMAMPSVITDIKKQLADGKSCVLQIVNTNAAQQERELARAKQGKGTEDEGILDDLDLTPRGTLIEYLNNAFPVSVYEEVEDDNGKKRFVALTGKNGEPVVDKEAVRLRDELIEKINQMKVPDGPLEMLFDAFGADNVAEVTGRTRRVVSKANENGQMVRVEESRSEKSALSDAQSFQDGKKRILIFSDAGGTGKSYHADLRAKNQQQRIHYLVQPGWSASKAVQGFGRTHRSNEASAPVYKLVTTDAMGQKRFVSTIARRLDQLGALTKGQRETGGGMFTAKDNLESPLARDALYNFYASLRYEAGAKELLTSMGLEDKFYDEHGYFKMNDEVGRDMNTFLNRILALTVGKQNETFSRFYSIFENAYDTALKNGTLDMGMETVKADKIEIVDDESVHKDEKTAAETRYIQAKVLRKPTIIRDVSTLPSLRENFIGLYRTTEGAVRAIYQIADKTNSRGEVSKMYKAQSPTYTKFGTWQQATLEANAQEIPRSEWMAAWAQEVAKQPEYDESTLHMLTGTLLPVWNLLPHTGSTKAMRVIADNGSQYLGRVIPENEVDGTLTRLGAPGRTKTEYTAQDIYDRVLKKGNTVRLYNDKVHFKRSRVNNEQRIEITGDNLWYYRRSNPDIIMERIAYQDRYFIPTNDTGIGIIEKLLKGNPVESVSADNDVDAMMSTGGAAQWSTPRVGGPREVTGIDAIIKKMRGQFGLPVTAGHIRGSGIRGQYDTHAVTVRTKIANDLPAAAHEIGHYLERTYDMLGKLSAESRDELKTNLDPLILAKNINDPDKAIREGFAEFIRRYMQNRDTAQIDYPKTSLQLRALLTEENMRSLDEISDDVNAYYSLGAQNALPELMTRKESTFDDTALKDKILDVEDRLYLEWVDANIGIRKFDRAAGSKAYVYATNSAYADSVSGEILSGDLYDMDGNFVSNGLRNAIADIQVGDKEEYAAFNEYLVVRNGPERLKEGMRVFANDQKNSTVWMNRRMSELEEEYPAFKEAANKLYTFQKVFLRTWGVKAGLVSKESADAWAKRWEFYVPFNRAMDKDGNAAGARRGYANQDSTIRKARGSGRSIVMPVDNIITNIVRMVSAAQRNRVMQELVNACENVEGMGRFLEEVPAPLKRTTIDLAPIKQKMADSVLETNPENLDAFLQMIQSFDDVAYQYEQGKAKGDVVTVLRDGNQQFYKVNEPLLLQSLVNMAPKQSKALLDSYGKVTRFVTANITGLNVVWSLFSNMPRDIGTYMFYSKNKNPINLFGGIASAYLNMVKGKNADPLYREYKAMGGGKTSAYTADVNLQRNMIRDFSGSKAKWLNPINWLEFVSNMIESGPRYATYRLLRTQYGASPADAFYASNDVTVNFRRGGTLGRQATKVIPFFNAGVQGVDKFCRWISAEEYAGNDRRKASTIRVTGFIVASLLMGALMHGLNSGDDDKKKEYAQLSTYTKNSFFCIPLGGGKYFTIPKPRELAVLASLMERTLELYENGNKDAFNGFYNYAAETSLPNVVSGIAQGDLFSAVSNLGLVGVIATVKANKDFLGRPIESQSMQNLLPTERFTRRTSVAAKAIGDVFGISPLQVDYVAKNILGGFWKWNQALFPIGKENVDYTLGVATSYVKDNQYSTDIVNALYDNYEDATLKKNSGNDPALGMKYKLLYNTTNFYTNYNKLSKGDPNADRSRVYRQTVLDMLDGMNQYAKNGPNTPEIKALADFVKRNGGTEQYPTALSTSVKDKNGIVHDLTASQYVDYQTDYLSRYWDYVGDVLASPETATEAGLKAAKAQARSEAETQILSTIGASSADASSMQTALSLGLNSKDIINFNTAKATASADGSFTKDEAMSIIDKTQATDAQKAYLYKEANGNATVTSNPYTSVEELNRYLLTADPEKTKNSITGVYKDLILDRFAAGDKAGMLKYVNKLLALNVYDKKGFPYYTQDMIDGWIDAYLKKPLS